MNIAHFRSIGTIVLSWALAVPSVVAAPANYALDAEHTSVHFAVSHLDISFVRGRFAKVAGSIQFDAENKTGALDLRVDLDSLETGNATLDRVLRSDQYLDTPQFGEASFGGATFVFDGDKLVAVDGTLILRGIPRPLRLSAQRFVCKDVRAGIVTRYVCGGEFLATLKRSDFGMTRFLSEVGDQVNLTIEVEATRR